MPRHLTTLLQASWYAVCIATRIVLWGMVCCAGTAAVMLVYLYRSLPDVEQITHISLQVPLRIYTEDGVLLETFGEKKRIPVPLDAIPPLLIQAVLLTEDARFYEHQGVDFKGLGRAAWHLLRTGHKGQGGGTITMQLARNVFLSHRKTYVRKLQEIMLAHQLEQHVSKHDILNLYLNKIYLGHRTYGVGAAAQVYYGKTMDQLTVAEMAMIAGLPQAPSAVNPISNPRAASTRRNHVLGRLLQHGAIDETTYRQALQTPVATYAHHAASHLQAPFVAEMVRQHIVSQFGDGAYTSGLQVYTTVDSTLQAHAEHVVASHLAAYQRRHPRTQPQPEAALIALHPAQGAILALVGGAPRPRNHFNRVTQAHLQPGSNFKPFVYAAALAKGFTNASIIDDAPVVYASADNQTLWRPRNHNLRFYGPTRLREALSQSRNLVSIRLLQSMGISYATRYLRHLGFEPEVLPSNLSMALGSGSITPLQLATGYAILANGGYRIEPHIVRSIHDPHHVLFQAEPPRACKRCPGPKARAVMQPQHAYLITSMLQEAIRTGTGRRALALGRTDLAGKTGTTNDLKDAWYSGYNASLVVTTWMGFDQPQSLHEYASSTTLPVWIDFMRLALQGIPDLPPVEPPGLVERTIDPTTGLLVPPDHPKAIIEIFEEHHLPDTAHAPEHAIQALDSLF